MSASDSTEKATRPVYVGEPTLGQVMRKPRWVLALILAMVVAGFFAWLGQWQLSHAITVEEDTSAVTETVRPIGTVTEPGATVTDAAAGMVVEVEGRFVAQDFTIVENRVHTDTIEADGANTAGELGVWIAGHLETTDGGALAVAVAWAADAAQAQQAITALEATAVAAAAEQDKSVVYEGRYMPADAAVLPNPGESRFAVASMAPAQLVNLWQPFESPAYSGYLVLHPSGDVSEQVLSSNSLTQIASVPPLPVETINWLNLFYAIEWVVFAGFAGYLWYRLARDDWEKIHELQLLTKSGQLDTNDGSAATAGIG